MQTAPPELPPEIVIDDYTEPRFSPDARAMLDAIAQAPAPPYEPQALLDAASAETGLDDFGADWFREPLDVLCRAIPQEAGLSATGRVTSGMSLVGMLANRLGRPWPVIPTSGFRL